MCDICLEGKEHSMVIAFLCKMVNKTECAVIIGLNAIRFAVDVSPPNKSVQILKLDCITLRTQQNGQTQTDNMLILIYCTSSL